MTSTLSTEIRTASNSNLLEIGIKSVNTVYHVTQQQIPNFHMLLYILTKEKPAKRKILKRKHCIALKHTHGGYKLNQISPYPCHTIYTHTQRGSL